MSEAQGKELQQAACSPFRQWAPLAAFVLAGVAAFALGWHDHLTLERIVANRHELKVLLAEHRTLAPVIYVLVYAVVIALSVPCGLVLTLTAGLLFGWFVGGLLATIAATIGAIIVFLIARSSLGEPLMRKAGPGIAKLRDGFRENAFSYLLCLRLVPVFPFWLVNLAPALLGVPLRTYTLATVVGIIPGAFAFASAGAGLDSIIAAAKAEYAACIAAKGAAACKLTINAEALMTKELVLAFVLLGLVALLPAALKAWRTRNAAL